MKTEVWNGRKIRFVEVNSECWAVAKDVAEALGIVSIKDSLRKMDSRYKGAYKVPTLGGLQKMLILNEKGLYRLIMRSNKKEAEEFQDWILDVIKQLRQSIGLEGFQVFKMLDKEHQKEAMAKLSHSNSDPKPKDFIKANTIANKAVSNLYGHSKMVKKDAMTPEMLVDRETILDETVQLMSVKEKYGLQFSVSEKIYHQTKSEIA